MSEDDEEYESAFSLDGLTEENQEEPEIEPDRERRQSESDYTPGEGTWAGLALFWVITLVVCTASVFVTGWIVGVLAADLGTGDWTLEFWYKHTRSADTSPSNGVFLSCSSTDMIVSIDTWGSASFIEPLYTGTTQSGGFSSKYTGTSKLAPHVWNHIAITRTSGDYNAFINGILSTYSSTLSCLPSLL